MTQKQIRGLSELAGLMDAKPAAKLMTPPSVLGLLRSEGFADRIYEADAEQPPLWFITDAGRRALAST